MAGILGPHEGKEFDLFRKDQKDLILFGEDGLPDDYNYWVATVGAQEHQFSAGGLNGFILYRKDHYEDAVKLGNLVKASYPKTASSIEIETEIGRLLGYDEQDIAAYIEQFTAHFGAD